MITSVLVFLLNTGLQSYHCEPGWLFRDDKIGRAGFLMFMEKNYKFNIPIKKFAELSGRSISSFQRECQLVLGMKATSWLKKRRLQEALRLLRSGLPASQVYLSVGFEDLSHFSRSFKKEFAISPSRINGHGNP